ncbi:TetR/AcrR family transcriptional regulator [Nocardia sp. X0981]
MVDTPETARDNVEKPARERLLDAVIEIIGREGQQKVTYRSVSGRASVAHGLVRHYFGTREAMLAEAMRATVQRDRAAAPLNVKTADDFGRGFVEVLDAEQDRQIVYFDLALTAIRGSSEKSAVVAGYEHYIADISQTLQTLGIHDSTEEWAALLLAALEGLILQHYLYGSLQRTEGVLDRMRELLVLLAEREQTRADSSVPPEAPTGSEN